MRDPDLALPYYQAKSRARAREILNEAYTAAMAEAGERGMLAYEVRALFAEHALAALEREAGLEQRMWGAGSGLVDGGTHSRTADPAPPAGRDSSGFGVNQ